MVPAKFLVGPNGQYISNPNTSPNTINSLATQYFNADGSQILNANPGNYLVVPYDYTLGHATQFASDVNNEASQGVSPDTMMVAAFTKWGSQNLQSRYQKADGSLSYNEAYAPMFQDAASFHLGLVSQLTGYGPTLAQLGGSAYDLVAQGINSVFGNITPRKAWDNNARNMNSIAGGADYATGYVPGPNPFNPGGLLEQGYVPQPDDVPPTNALAAFTNLYAARTNRNALIGPVY